MDAAPRARTAETFLVEAVYRSRGKQAALAGGSNAPAADGGRCGLGEEAAVELALDQRGLDLFHRLWPEGLDDARLAGVRDQVAAWVKRQDGLDRERNHFMKGFRQQHGMDRGAYYAEQQRAWRDGLDAVNDRENVARAEAAAKLLDV